MFAECYGGFGFDSRAETVKDESFFYHIPNLSNKYKAEAKADAYKSQLNKRSLVINMVGLIVKDMNRSKKSAVNLFGRHSVVIRDQLLLRSLVQRLT
jgi:hypothetical protein